MNRRRGITWLSMLWLAGVLALYLFQFRELLPAVLMALGLVPA